MSSEEISNIDVELIQPGMIVPPGKIWAIRREVFKRLAKFWWEQGLFFRDGEKWAWRIRREPTIAQALDDYDIPIPGTRKFGEFEPTRIQITFFKGGVNLPTIAHELLHYEQAKALLFLGKPWKDTGLTRSYLEYQVENRLLNLGFKKNPQTIESILELQRRQNQR